MTRDRYVDVYIPVGPGADAGYSGVGVVGSMAALFGGVVAFAALTCVVVSCADFGEGAQIPASTCEPFCTVTSTAHPVQSAEATR
ncbi:hypothetical protein [Nocardia carnea]|uniref:hypothetical protein n=1 Tax=Nocardia carnea TaxID=37328 RepID=UPI002454432F|nr:hypothetical protein [Nocardia carnea]